MLPLPAGSIRHSSMTWSCQKYVIFTVIITACFKFSTIFFYKVRSAGRALSKSSSQIPEKKKQQLQSIIANHFKIAASELSDDHVTEASQINPK
jgi:hypothetical protein